MAGTKRGTPRPTSANGETTEEVAAIPLVEERLTVTKRQVESGRVRVHVTVEEREEVVTEQILRDELQIERVPRNVRITEVPHVRLEGNTTIVPVVQEVVVVEKALLLVEEIHICRRSVTETAEIPVSLRSERARIEREVGEEPATAAE
jgi:uncharacterized protein (TIGR02271 family)